MALLIYKVRMREGKINFDTGKPTYDFHFLVLAVLGMTGLLNGRIPSRLIYFLLATHANPYVSAHSSACHAIGSTISASELGAIAETIRCLSVVCH